jgi:hypothetical protein
MVFYSRRKSFGTQSIYPTFRPTVYVCNPRVLLERFLRRTHNLMSSNTTSTGNVPGATKASMGVGIGGVGVFAGNVIERASTAPKALKPMKQPPAQSSQKAGGVGVPGFPRPPPKARTEAKDSGSSDKDNRVGATLTSPTAASRTRFPVEEEDESDDDHEDNNDDSSPHNQQQHDDNVQSILSMTPEQLSAAMSEISSTFSAESIKFLTNRGLKDSKTTNDLSLRLGRTHSATTDTQTKASKHSSSSPASSSSSASGVSSMSIPNTLQELEQAKRSAPPEIRASLSWTIDDDSADAPDTNNKSDKNTDSSNEGNSTNSTNCGDSQIVRANNTRPRKQPQFKSKLNTQSSSAASSSQSVSFPLARMSKDRFDLQGRKVLARSVLIDHVLAVLQSSFGKHMHANTNTNTHTNANTNSSNNCVLADDQLRSVSTLCVDRMMAIGVCVEPAPADTQPQDELRMHQYDRDAAGYSLSEICEVREIVRVCVCHVSAYMCDC